ncbi:hypothetical protein LMG7974_01277 [Campylobacter majalis]|uniref:DUF262 domain-containing protein n=1 Tax=Campylobacter majalis TaxID=2790656 RepID=A0ABM8Q837_9BACT|nr:DUF262 domain-containing protein [Campylobacter majalis]CAD7288974.1 hypothetical protein LMG7974_01277 [Campylobacter majalis]
MANETDLNVDNGLCVGTASIGEILELENSNSNEILKGKTLSIPNYQRPYTWSTQNVNELIDDILEAIELGKEQYLIGNIILHENDGNLDIIDGQQRLTTLALILKYCGSECKFLKQKPNINSKNALIRNYNVIKQKITDKTQAMDFIKNKLCVTYSMVKSIDEAFDIFDTQNTRGKGLTDAELLKNHHFSYICVDETMQKQIAQKHKEYQNKKTLELWWNANFSMLESALNDIYIARKIFNGENFTMGYYIEWDRRVFGEFKGIKNSGYTRELPMKFSSNIIKGNEYFDYLFTKTELYESIFKKCEISHKYYINQAMRIMMIFYVDKYTMDKNFERFFDLTFLHMFAVMSYYSAIHYNAWAIIDRLKHIFGLVKTSDFSGYLIEKMQDDILANCFSIFLKEDKKRQIKENERALNLLTDNYKDKEKIKENSFGIITLKESKNDKTL